jgi:aminomethyltransferase
MSKPDAPVARTPLHALHLRLGGRMVPFAGHELPVQYTGGIIREHLHTRRAAGLFDISHMGQIVVRPRSGRLPDAAAALETLVPADVRGLGPGRQLYTLFTDETGGVLDDLMVSNQGDHLLLVVNAAGRVADAAHLQAGLGTSCLVEPRFERALIALQGPRAGEVLATLVPATADMRFMEARSVIWAGQACSVSRSGYTGEDGFEIGIAAEAAENLCEALLRHPAVAPAGLGARDSLRLEAGLCLYGADLDRNTTPVEAALEWTVPKVRRAGGARAGGFPGAAVILRQLAGGAPRRRVGLRPEGRAPVRAGAALFRAEDDAAPIGAVTSGGFGPSLDAPIAMGYVPAAAAAPGTRLLADLRGRRVPVAVVPLPFVPHRYRRL